MVYPLRGHIKKSIYKKLKKIQFKIFFVLSILLMAAPFSYHLGLVALITTVLIAGSTMAYLYIQQQHAIDRIQSTLYNICLIADNAETENDSGVGN